MLRRSTSNRHAREEQLNKESREGSTRLGKEPKQRKSSSSFRRTSSINNNGETPQKRNYTPTSEEVMEAVQSIIVELQQQQEQSEKPEENNDNNNNADSISISHVHATLLARNETWKVPERRTTKFAKRFLQQQQQTQNHNNEHEDDDDNHSLQSASSLGTTSSANSKKRRSFKQKLSRFSPFRPKKQQSYPSLLADHDNNGDDDDDDEDLRSVTSRGSIRNLFSRSQKSDGSGSHHTPSRTPSRRKLLRRNASRNNSKSPHPKTNQRDHSNAGEQEEEESTNHSVTTATESSAYTSSSLKVTAEDSSEMEDPPEPLREHTPLLDPNALLSTSAKETSSQPVDTTNTTDKLLAEGRYEEESVHPPLNEQQPAMALSALEQNFDSPTSSSQIENLLFEDIPEEEEVVTVPTHLQIEAPQEGKSQPAAMTTFFQVEEEEMDRQPAALPSSFQEEKKEMDKQPAALPTSFQEEKEEMDRQPAALPTSFQKEEEEMDKQRSHELPPSPSWSITSPRSNNVCDDNEDEERADCIKPAESATTNTTTSMATVTSHSTTEATSEKLPSTEGKKDDEDKHDDDDCPKNTGETPYSVESVDMDTPSQEKVEEQQRNLSDGTTETATRHFEHDRVDNVEASGEGKMISLTLVASLTNNKDDEAPEQEYQTPAEEGPLEHDCSIATLSMSTDSTEGCSDAIETRAMTEEQTVEKNGAVVNSNQGSNVTDTVTTVDAFAAAESTPATYEYNEYYNDASDPQPSPRPSWLIYASKDGHSCRGKSSNVSPERPLDLLTVTSNNSATSSPQHSPLPRTDQALEPEQPKWKIWATSNWALPSPPQMCEGDDKKEKVLCSFDGLNEKHIMTITEEPEPAEDMMSEKSATDVDTDIHHIDCSEVKNEDIIVAEPLEVATTTSPSSTEPLEATMTTSPSSTEAVCGIYPATPNPVDSGIVQNSDGEQREALMTDEVANATTIPSPSNSASVDSAIVEDFDGEHKATMEDEDNAVVSSSPSNSISVNTAIGEDSDGERDAMEEEANASVASPSNSNAGSHNTSEDTENVYSDYDASGAIASPTNSDAASHANLDTEETAFDFTKEPIADFTDHEENAERSNEFSQVSGVDTSPSTDCSEGTSMDNFQANNDHYDDDATTAEEQEELSSVPSRAIEQTVIGSGGNGAHDDKKGNSRGTASWLVGATLFSLVLFFGAWFSFENDVFHHINEVVSMASSTVQGNKPIPSPIVDDHKVQRKNIKQTVMFQPMPTYKTEETDNDAKSQKKEDVSQPSPTEHISQQKQPQLQQLLADSILRPVPDTPQKIEQSKEHNQTTTEEKSISNIWGSVKDKTQSQSPQPTDPSKDQQDEPVHQRRHSESRLLGSVKENKTQFARAEEDSSGLDGTRKRQPRWLSQLSSRVNQGKRNVKIWWSKVTAAGKNQQKREPMGVLTK